MFSCAITDLPTVLARRYPREMLLNALRLLPILTLLVVVRTALATTPEQGGDADLSGCRTVTDAFDPCLIDELTWDGSTITNFVCGEPRLLPDQTAALIAVANAGTEANVR